MESQYVNDTMLADDLLQAEKRKERARRKRELKLQRYRGKIVALKRCGYLDAEEETRTWS